MAASFHAGPLRRLVRGVRRLALPAGHATWTIRFALAYWRTKAMQAPRQSRWSPDACIGTQFQSNVTITITTREQATGLGNGESVRKKFAPGRKFCLRVDRLEKRML
jgi:hypothetical protein